LGGGKGLIAQAENKSGRASKGRRDLDTKKGPERKSKAAVLWGGEWNLWYWSKTKLIKFERPRRTVPKMLGAVVGQMLLVLYHTVKAYS